MYSRFIAGRPGFKCLFKCLFKMPVQIHLMNFEALADPMPPFYNKYIFYRQIYILASKLPKLNVIMPIKNLKEILNEIKKT